MFQILNEALTHHFSKSLIFNMSLYIISTSLLNIIFLYGIKQTRHSTMKLCFLVNLKEYIFGIHVARIPIQKKYHFPK